MFPGSTSSLILTTLSGFAKPLTISGWRLSWESLTTSPPPHSWP